MATPGPAAGPRDRLLSSAVALVRRNGVAGTGLNELLEHSQTARGSVYQHFPGGKEELVATATRSVGEAMARRMQEAAGLPDPVAIVQAVVRAAARGLVDHDFELGCPIVAAATSGPGHGAAVSAAADTFTAWVGALQDGFVGAGIAEPEAEGFASLVVSAVEGAIVQARAARSLVPLDHVGEQLSGLARLHAA